MGWDLTSRGDKHYFRVNAWAWPKLAMALEFLGADIEKMATDNSGKFVPAGVAREWASVIETGIDSLRIAVARDPDVQSKEGWFLVRSDQSEKEIRKMLREFYGGPEKFTAEYHDDEIGSYSRKITVRGYRSYPLKRVEPLSDEMRRFLLGFAAFCRKSGGFYQW
jgi:hypothetical protein